MSFVFKYYVGKASRGSSLTHADFVYVGWNFLKPLVSCAFRSHLTPCLRLALVSTHSRLNIQELFHVFAFHHGAALARACILFALLTILTALRRSRPHQRCGPPIGSNVTSIEIFGPSLYVCIRHSGRSKQIRGDAQKSSNLSLTKLQHWAIGVLRRDNRYRTS
ncbi:hypothetical protein EI94DRAFT_867743 [Lactarius quietus]|nr:hypothetical protein EI94DRAFT_867743 [Lactarius quietus]